MIWRNRCGDRRRFTVVRLQHFVSLIEISKVAPHWDGHFPFFSIFVAVENRTKWFRKWKIYIRWACLMFPARNMDKNVAWSFLLFFFFFLVQVSAFFFLFFYFFRFWFFFLSFYFLYCRIFCLNNFQVFGFCFYYYYYYCFIFQNKSIL